MGKGYKSNGGRAPTAFEREVMKINERNRDKDKIKYPELYQKAINDRINSMDSAIKDMSKGSAPAKVYGLEVLNLSKSVQNILKRNGINSANDFFQFEKSSSVLSLDGIGHKRFQELFCARVRLSLIEPAIFSYLDSLESPKKGSS